MVFGSYITCKALCLPLKVIKIFYYSSIFTTRLIYRTYPNIKILKVRKGVDLYKESTYTPENTVGKIKPVASFLHLILKSCW